MLDTIAIPFAWLLRNIYLLVGNYGLSLIVFTLAVKLILLPFGMKSKKSMMKTSRLAPKMKELEKKYKDDQLKYQNEVSRLYKEEGVNPMSGCLWSFLPLPILIGLYGVIREPLTNLMQLSADEITLLGEFLAGKGLDFSGSNAAYTEISMASYVHEYIDEIRTIIPGIIDIDFNFLGLDLSQIPQWSFWFDGGFFQQDAAVVWGTIGLFFIPILSGAMNFFSSWLMQKMNNSVATNDKGEKDDSAAAAANKSMRSMLYMMPLMSVWIGFIMPAGICVYWIASSFFSMIQDIILTKHYRKVYDAEDAVKAERAAELAAIEAEREAKWAEKRAQNPEGAANPNTSRRKVKKQQKAQEIKAPEGKLTPEQREELHRKQEELERRVEEGFDPNRPYARGRAYVAERFTTDAEETPEEESGSAAEDEASADTQKLLEGENPTDE